MTTQFLGKEVTETLRGDDPSYRLREVDQTAPAGMWQMNAQGGDMLFQASTSSSWSSFTDVVTLESTPAVTIHGTLTVSGTIVFAADVRLDDDIVVLFGDDSDYYMGYSATDDLLEIGTGSAIASNVGLSMTSAGFVGVGDPPSQDAPLHVYHATNNTMGIFQSGNGTAILKLRDSASDSTYPPQIQTTGDVVQLQGGTTAGQSNGYVAVDATGKVGIAITTPQSDFHLDDASGGIVRFQMTNNTTGAASEDVGLRIDQNGVNTIINNLETGSMTFQTDALPRMTILATGDVGGVFTGIGVTNPLQRLHVEGVLRVDEGGSNYTMLGHNQLQAVGTILYIQYSDAYNIVMFGDPSNDSQSLVLSSNTLTQVGNAASEWASGALLIHSAAIGSHAKIELNMLGGGGGDAVIRFQENGSSQFTIGIDDNDDEKFKISDGGDLGSNDRLTIDSAGAVTIGGASSFGGQVTNEVNVIHAVVEKSSMTDNVATIFATITTTDETGDNDGGVYTVFINAMLSQGGGAGNSKKAVKAVKAMFVHVINDDHSTAVTSAVTEISESASAAISPSERDIGAVTFTTSAASVYVTNVLVQIDATGTDTAGVIITADMTVVYKDFLTPPVIVAV